MIRNEKTYGFFRKTKKYGLVGCISFCGILVYGLTDNNQIVNKQAHAAVVKGGADIVDADVHNKETSGVAMTYTSFDSNGSKQVASGSGVFVAPNVMVTVAHNYLDKDKASGSGYVRGGNSAQSYVVMNSDTEKRNNTPATGTSDIIPKGNIYYYNQKEFAKSYENDLAAVVTERPVEAMTNGEDKPREIGVANQGDNITLVGYPNDFSSKRLSEATKARLKDGKMYKISGTLSSLNTTTGDGTYNTSALGGFSGGPIFNDKGEVVGIHQHGTNTDAGTDAEQHGGGLFFTDKHRSWINKMIEEHGIKGWFVSGNDKYYYDDNHRALVGTEREIDGARYSFDINGRGRLLSGTEKGKVVLRIKNEAGEKLVERVVAQGNVGSAVNYDFKQDKENKELFGKNPNATIVSIDGEKINKKFNENWSKDFVSKLSLGNTYIDAVIKGDNFVRTQPGKVDTSGNVTLPKPSDEVKNAPNGLRNFDATTIIVTPDGTGSGTLIEKDLLLTVAHNFLKFENGKVTEKATGNNDKKYYAALPNGKKVFFTDSDIHYWKKDDSVVGFTHDLALVKLKEVVDNVKPAAVKKDVSVINSGDKVSVYGFPDGKLKPVIDTNVTDVVDRGSGLTGIGYTGTKPGASGGGLYNNEGEIIGVHQNGVVGQRSGGLVFSKEQLDWVKSYIDGKPKEPVYREEENVDYGIVEKEEKIPFSTKYVADEELTKGKKSVIKKGIDGIIKTTYIKDKDGNLTLDKETKEPAVDQVVKVGVKSVENTKEILSNTVYVADKEKARGLSNERIEGSNGYEKEVIKYTLNEKDGTISETVEKKEKKATDTIIKVPAKDKVEVTEIPSPIRYEKDSTREKGQKNITIPGQKGTKKVTTMYEVNPKTGEVTEKVEKPEVKEATETVVKVAAKDKVEVTEIPSPIRYEKDSTREKGQNNITIPGEKGTRKVTTTYEVNSKTGEVTERVGNPEVTEATETVVKVAAKDKVEVTEIPSPVRYEKDSTREKGQKNITILGQKGTKKVTTMYEVNPKTGEVTGKVGKPEVKEATETVVKVAEKDKVEVTEIPSPIRYEKDSTREKGQKNINIPGQKGTRKVTTTYEVNPKTGEVTQRVGTPEVKEATETVVKVAAKDKVEVTEIPSPVRYEKDSTREKGQNNITIPGEKGTRKVTTMYEVNPKTGEVTQRVGTPEVKNATETVVKVAAKDKIEVVQRENGKKVKVTTIYTVDVKTGNTTQTEREEEIFSEVITSKSEEKVPTIELKPYEGGVNPAESVVTEELKPYEGGVNPVESVVTEELNPFEGGVNPVESVVTEELNPFEGGVNPVESVVTEELKSFEGGVNPVESVVTEELKPFEGGVNPSESVVTEELKPFEGGVNVEIPAVKEELSELKLALLKDEEGNILDVLAISEKPKELSGYKYTGKEKVDNEGNKIYIYQKDNSEVVTSKSDEKVPTIELKPFEGGVNPEESVVTEELKPFEGGVNPEESVVTEELKPFEGGVNPVETVVTEELKPFEGGVNPEESVVTEELKPFEDGEIPAVKEELPELKLALLKDEEGNILDVLAISEKPKELSGYKYTGKEKLDSEGNKIYIYQKVELENINNKKQDTIVVNQSQVLKENIESKTEITTDKNDKKIVDKKLPNTGETPLENGLLGGMLLAATMMLAKRKVKK